MALKNTEKSYFLSTKFVKSAGRRDGFLLNPRVSASVSVTLKSEGGRVSSSFSTEDNGSYTFLHSEWK
jgi:hypothetical protein